jgi:hypothetical protein
MTLREAEKYLADVAMNGIKSASNTDKEEILLRKELGLDMESVRAFAKQHMF